MVRMYSQLRLLVCSSRTERRWGSEQAEVALEARVLGKWLERLTYCRESARGGGIVILLCLEASPLRRSRYERNRYA